MGAPPDSTQMARWRTALAADRTLMAWVRTSLSMISFGFSISKFFQYLHESGAGTNPNAPRNLGLTLTGLGVIGVVLAILQHQQSLKGLGVASARERWSVTPVIAVAIAIIGAIVFLSGLTRIGPF
jgi:putative membrane protein